MIQSIEDFDYEWFKNVPLQKRKRGNQGNKAGVKYKDIISAFDIETSYISEIQQNAMYIWQWQFGPDITVIGRTWDEFREFTKRLTELMGEHEALCVFIHNASYEFQFLRGIYQFQSDEVFATDSRKVLKFTMYNHFEFRCSYFHSNMSLAQYMSKMGVSEDLRKLSGEEFDYSKVRYPWTELSERELLYCINDVRGLVQAIRIDMENEDDNIYTFPLTSTGYVRRDAKRAMQNVHHLYVKGMLPNFHVYSMLREAFRGGDTHANRLYAGKVIHNVKSADRSSSYPDVQCNCEMPISCFFEAGECTPEYVEDCIFRRHKAVLMRVAFHYIRLHDEDWGCPYLSRDKCRYISDGLYDNGRILCADYLETTITDVDFKIISKEYDFESYNPFDVCTARYGFLPQPLIDVTISYYKKKTELKNVPGQEIYYTKNKNKLNSVYGMCAQDPVRWSDNFDNNEWIPFELSHDEWMEYQQNELIKSNRKAFLAYQWGVWVTAWARYRLHEGIALAGDQFIYCDTDSVKYVGDIDWSRFNNQRIKDSIESGAYATDPKGVTHYMGVFEYEGEYSKFSTLGAKKYIYEIDGHIECTIAGVNKSLGGKELEAHGGFNAFKPGFIFTEAGGNESVYNDHPEFNSISIDGHELEITPNIVINKSTYTLGITAEYEFLLNNPKLLGRTGYL